MARPGASLQQLFTDEGSHAWDKAWKQSVTPWDVGVPQPPLIDLLASKKLPLPTSGRALVPGCGKAYDAIAIASTLGLDTVAVDISPTAVEAAKEFVQNAPLAPPGSVTLQLGDFFELDESKPFELIYDYTFFVALPPARRPEWASKTSALSRPGTYLITLIAPLGLEDDKRGPPFYVIPEHYDEVLKGWEKVFEEQPVDSVPGRTWLQKLVVWKKL